MRFKILQFDAGAEAAFAFAKNQCRRLVLAGQDNFRREWYLEGFKITARCSELQGEHVVRLWLEGSGVVDAAYALGATFPALFLNRQTLEPSFINAPAPLAASDIYGAIVADAKVIRAQAYGWAAGVYVTFDSTLFNFFAQHVVDTEVGDAYTVPVPTMPTKIDFTGRRLWHSVSGFAAHRSIFWLAADLDRAVSGYSAAFQLALTEGRVPDGDQVFHIPMANGRFTVSVTVSFLAGAIANVDTSAAHKGLWKLVLTATSLDKDGLLTFTYTQKVNNVNAVLIVDSITLHVPDDVQSSSLESFYIQPDGVGGFQDITIPATRHVSSYGIHEFVNTPAVSSDPFLIGYITRATYDEDLSGTLVAVGNGGSGHQPYTMALNIFVTGKLTAVFSDGTTQDVNDPTVPITGASSLPPWQAPVPVNYEIIGANVPRYSYTYPGGDEFDLRHMPFSEKGPALGYEVARFASTVQPSSYERIEIRTLDGTVLRTAYRSMAQLVIAVVGIENYTVVTVDDTGAWVQAGTHTSLAHAQTTAPPFVLYDAMVSVNEHVFTFAKMSKAHGISAESSLAVVPPGWAVARTHFQTIVARTVLADTANDYEDIAKALEDFSDEVAHPTRWLKDDSGTMPPELQDAHARIAAIIGVCRYFEGAVVDTDLKHVTGILDTVVDFFSAYADAGSDGAFLDWVKALRATFTDPAQPRTTVLTAAEFVHLFTGYLSTHMRIALNPFNVPYSTILCLGAGSWFWGTA